MEQQIPLVDLKIQFKSVRNEIYTAWDEVFSTMQLFLGPNVQAFENEFAAYCGVKYAIGVSDGTEALYLALRAAGIGPGDEVITVSHTFIATGEAILLAGAKPIFVDIDPKTYLIDVNQIESKISDKTRALVPVHLYGQTADMDPILDIAKRHRLAVIEDACQAHGAEYKGRKAGSIGTLGGFSFYFTKNLGAYGEGGMVTTNNADLAHQVRMLRDHGSEKRYLHEVIGVNGRLDELQAAVLSIKLKHLEEWNDRRRRNAACYKKALEDLNVITPLEAPENRHVYHLYVIQTPQRDDLRAWLNEHGIGTGIHYPVPIHLQKACTYLGYLPGSFPVTEKLVNEILSLPMYPELNEAQIDLISGSIHEFLANKGYA